jgi:hypothetical protein
MLRSALAIVVGFVYIAALSFGADALLRAVAPEAFGPDGRMDGTGTLLLVIGYVAVFAISGCYLAARIAPSHPMRHALFLGLLGLIVNIMGTVTMWNTAPAWYHVVSLLLVLPYAYVGGRLREMELARAGRPGSPIAGAAAGASAGSAGSRL